MNNDGKTNTEQMTDKEYYTLMGDVRDKVKEALPDERNYVNTMCMFFEKYDTKEGRARLRRVFNGAARDLDVIRDFEKLPGLIKKCREIATELEAA